MVADYSRYQYEIVKAFVDKKDNLTANECYQFLVTYLKKCFNQETDPLLRRLDPCVFELLMNAAQ